MEDYKTEILIIGDGPAGCSAAIYCGRAQRETILLSGKEESALLKAHEVSNYPGFDKITGKELLENFRGQVKKYDSVKVIQGDVIAYMVGMGVNLISTRTGNITADTVIIATGKGQRKEKIKGEEALTGFGVSYCALCDGPLYRDRTVFLYGNDEEVLEEALILQQMGCIVKIMTEVGIDKLPKKIEEVKRNNIEVIDNCQIIEIIGNKKGIIEKIVCKSTDPAKQNEMIFELDCLFILSHIPSNSIFKKGGVELDERGNIKIDKEQKTSVEGVFAAGDVTGGVYQVVFAAAEGARAGLNANKYLRQIKKE